MSHSIQHVHFRSGALGAPLAPGPTAELDRLTAALRERLVADPIDVEGVRWRDRPQRYQAWFERALDEVLAQDSTVTGGWTVDSNVEPSITSPDGDRWLRMNGASFALTHEDATVTGETFLSIIDESALAAGPQVVQLALQNDMVDEANGAVLFIDSRRARVDSLRADDPLAMQVGERDSRSTDAWIARFPTPLQRGVRLTFEVEFEGDLPYLRNVLWVARDGADVLDPSAKFDDTPRAITPEALAQAETLGRTRAEELEHRERMIQSSSTGDRWVFQQFFLDLDRDPAPGTTEERRLRQLTSYLGQRVMVRAEEAGFGETPEFDQDDLELWRPDFVAVAASVEALALYHLPELAQADTTRLEAAFEQFATGALRVFGTHGAPNGVSYFSFCELAILMTGYGDRGRFWAPLIPLFARTSELFVNAYHQCNGPRTLSAYGVAYNPTGARTQGPAELAANRAAWALVDDAVYSFGRIVNAALHDELVPGTVAPFALEDFGCGADSLGVDTTPSRSTEGALDRNWRGGKSSWPKA